MKQVIGCVCAPGLFARFARLFTPLIQRHDTRRKGRADRLSSHMLRDIGLSDEARGEPLYGSTRRRW